MSEIAASELVLNSNGSIYHLNLHPEQVARTIITVGDPGRVTKVSQYFDKIEYRIEKREFLTHTGYLGRRRLSVISTGIGTDNIDIVINELDALVNIDLKTRRTKKEITGLTFIRVGTCGGLRADQPVDSVVVSSHALGLDNLMHFYHDPGGQQDNGLLQAIRRHLGADFSDRINPYLAAAPGQLLSLWPAQWKRGITVTCPGFYAPQGRRLRISPVYGDLLSQLQNFERDQLVCRNFEMETSALYGLAGLLGHQAVSISTVLANRTSGAFSTDPKRAVKSLIEQVLEVLELAPEAE